jgi:hypothetical protein
MTVAQFATATFPPGQVEILVFPARFLAKTVRNDTGAKVLLLHVQLYRDFRQNEKPVFPEKTGFGILRYLHLARSHGDTCRR